MIYLQFILYWQYMVVEVDESFPYTKNRRKEEMKEQMNILLEFITNLVNKFWKFH